MPSDAVWVASGQWDSWTNNGYTLNNDELSGTAGQSDLVCNSFSLRYS